ncbi:MAG TPA: hypothetical protein VMH04_09190 [Candidatus Solibacter sp.]|nr:hypothetical protein [Candidatus Solibacter sp.]
MEKGPQEAFDTIRKHLQVILLRAELCQTPQQCEACAGMVCEIVKEVRALEAFVREAAKKQDS